MIRSRTIIATPPGATIREQLEFRGMRQNEFAKRMGLSEKHVSLLINGEVSLSHEVALRLESVLGIPAEVWNSLEARYQEKAARAIAENQMDEDIALAKLYPYNDMAKQGWVPATRNAVEKVDNLRRFFEVAMLSNIGSLCIPGISYRCVGKSVACDFALAAWAQRARLQSRDIRVSPIDLKKLAKLLGEFRALTTEEPSTFSSKLAGMLASCGIALVLLPHIGGSFLHGAAFRDGNRIVLGLTARGKDADKFWFSFFHELGHIIKGHMDLGHDVGEEQEDEADEFARDTLIPCEKFKAYVMQGAFTKASVVAFSRDCEVDSGIIVGRLQKEGIIGYDQLNGLKTKYRITA